MVHFGHFMSWKSRTIAHFWIFVQRVWDFRLELRFLRGLARFFGPIEYTGIYCNFSVDYKWQYFQQKIYFLGICWSFLQSKNISESIKSYPIGLNFLRVFFVKRNKNIGGLMNTILKPDILNDIRTNCKMSKTRTTFGLKFTRFSRYIAEFKLSLFFKNY